MTDSATILLCLIFGVVSFLTIGAATVTYFGVSIDAGIASGVGYVVSVPLVLLVIRALGKRKHPLVRWLRLFYVQIFYLAFFSSTIKLSYRLFDGRSLDSIFASLDSWLFGMQPALELYRAMPGNRIVVELFFFAYGSYYFLFSCGIWLLFARGRERQAYQFLATVTLAFYLLYLFYLVFPVAGPKYFFDSLREQWYTPFRGYLFTTLLTSAFDGMDLYGAAFPSSHAAISVLSLLMNLRYQRTLGMVTLPVVLLLLVSTVYIYAHYAVDTIAGVIVGVVCFLVLPRWIPSVEAAFGKVWKRIGAKQPATG